MPIDARVGGGWAQPVHLQAKEILKGYFAETKTFAKDPQNFLFAAECQPFASINRPLLFIDVFILSGFTISAPCRRVTQAGQAGCVVSQFTREFALNPILDELHYRHDYQVEGDPFR